MAYKLKLPLGLKDGQLLHISEVPRGLVCGCICPGCNKPLVARKGNKMAHHFAHHNSEECESAYESALHLAAKKILNERKELVIPDVNLHFSSGRSSILVASQQTIALEKVELEKAVEDIRPDLLVYHKSTPIIIEIYVTHKVGKSKLAKIRGLGISAIEIDLSGMDQDFTLDKLERLIVGEVRNKKWLYNKKMERLKGLFIKIADLKPKIVRGLASHVDNCPMGMRVWKGRHYANIVDDCSLCDYAYEIGPNMEYIICGGKTGVSTIEELKEYLKPKK